MREFMRWLWFVTWLVLGFIVLGVVMSIIIANKHRSSIGENLQTFIERGFE